MGARALLWSRLDVPGTDVAFVTAGPTGVHVGGTAVVLDPAPLCCHYLVDCSPDWTVRRLTVGCDDAEGARSVEVVVGPGGWTVDGRLRKDLGDAVDVDIDVTALTNTLPVRRLGLVSAPAGTSAACVMAWVRLPSLEVERSEQTYTVLDHQPGAHRIRYQSGDFVSDILFDDDGYVVDYPGYAVRAAP